MKVKIRLFASFKEAVGTDSLELDVPEGSTLAQVMDVFSSRYPKAERLAKIAVFALNQEYVSPDKVAHEGDEIVFIPPVSGGRYV